MARRPLFLQLFLPSLLVLILALVATAWEASRFLRSFDLEQTSSNLETTAWLIEPRLSPVFRANDAAAAEALCKELGGLARKRVTAVLPTGTVIGDSDEDPANMDNHADRPEIREAFAGRVGQSIRHSFTLRVDLVYVAIPVYVDGELAGVVRVSQALAAIESALTKVYSRLAAACAVIASLGACVSFLIARRIARPLRRIQQGAERFARGDFSKRLPMPSAAELAEVVSAMNDMAGQLDTRIQTIHRQRDELQAVLASMDEGVLAVDRSERVISINRAAALLFAVAPETAQGRHVLEVVRDPRLHECVTRTLSSAETVEDDVILGSVGERHLHVTSTVLHDERDAAVGALLVLNDVTELRRLERARSEFVANVSHEIRTPVTSIKGYTETLLSGAMDDPETATRFLEIVARQSERLSALVDDILSLASLERADMAADVTFEKVRVRGLIETAIHVCTPKASDRQVRFAVSCEDSLEVEGNGPLLEQALVNLLDNATKYSEPDSEVRVEAERDGAEIAIHVQDFGCGIAPEHVPRVFERFYRVDRARSRKLGGTGLGLAIVKHIVRLHGGRVTVESTLGKGSRFTLHLLTQR